MSQTAPKIEAFDDRKGLGINLKSNKPFQAVIIEKNDSDRVELSSFLSKKQFSIIFEAEKTNDLFENFAIINKRPELILISFKEFEDIQIKYLKDLQYWYKKSKFFLIVPRISEEFLKKIKKLAIKGVVTQPFNPRKVEQKLIQLFNRPDLIEDDQAHHSDYNDQKVNFKHLIIPGMPAIAIQVLNFDNDNPVGGSAELEKIIYPDVSLTSDLIRIANSSYFGRAGSIHSLQDAITLLGMNSIRNLVILQFEKAFIKELKGELFNKYLQILPVLTAFIAFDLVRVIKIFQLKKSIFIYSLFRKLGMTILAINFKEEYTKILGIVETTSRSVYLVEKEKFETNSIQLACRLFTFWKMPKIFHSIVENQNFPLADLELVGDEDRILRLAEIFAKPLLGMEVTIKEQGLKEAILKYYNAPKKLNDKFDTSYYDRKKEHPFFDLYV